MKLKVPSNMSLRNVISTDHEFLVDLHNDPDVLHNLTDPTPITLEHHLAWWKGIETSTNQRRLIFTIDGNRAGFTKFYSIDRANSNCVLGADLAKSYRGMGLAKYMWSLMLDTCFNELNLYRVSLTTASYNEIAQRVYRGLGFKEEGRFTQSLRRNNVFYDQILMYMLRSWYDTSTQESQ
jgi:RimJ/RimL family protein N-acetyltransferase